MSDELFSLKMRASQGERHISGAEKILTEKQLSASLGTLLTRALKHAAGEPDFINFKVEKLNPDSILHIDALPVKTISAQTPEDMEEIRRQVEKHCDELFTSKRIAVQAGAASHGKRGIRVMKL